jgi:rare lipoprotein A
MNIKVLIPVLMILGLAACSSAPKKPSSASSKGVKVEGRAYMASDCPPNSPYAPAQEDPSTRGDYVAGGLYKPGVKDSTPDHVPNVACIPEPLVTREPRSAVGNKSPYEVLGKRYVVRDDPGGYVERGTASYYGSKFHGRLTSNKEVYDMYAFTAAHKTLPLPSFALVTNVDNGESVVVRVNDRGPFHDGRVIDLSYAAAVKLGITARGTGNVEVRGLTEADNPTLLARHQKRGTTAAAIAVAKADPKPKDSEIDKLVGKLPPKPAAVPAASVATTAVAATDSGERWRYRVADGKATGNADNFDAWMKAQGVHVATGQPATVASSASAPSTPSRAAVVAAASAPVVTLAVADDKPVVKVEPVVDEAKPSMAEAALGNILLQVASFASRENANRALAQLASAGIVGASISDIAAGGRTMWRLRVNARDHASASELASRIAGLGFGQPQIVTR